MINKRFLKTAKRWKNEQLVRQRTPTPQPNTNFPENPDSSFIFRYDGFHGEYFQELIAKSNETFGGTKAQIPTGNSGEIQGHLIKRLGLITTIYNNPQLKSHNLWPITATQSEYLLKEEKLPKPKEYWEAFGMVLYDRSQNGYNPKEAQAIYDSLRAHRQDLGLSQSDLEGRLIVVNPGAEVDSMMPHGVKPIIIPGITQVYQHEVLEKVGENLSFDGYGLNGGLPLIKQLGNGRRFIHMPDETQDVGLSVLFRDWCLGLRANDRNFTYSVTSSRVNFAPQSALPKK